MRLIGTIHLPIHRQPTLYQLQVEKETTPFFEDPTPSTKFIKMTDPQFTKKNQECVTIKEDLRQEQPLQAIQRNL